MLRLGGVSRHALRLRLRHTADRSTVTRLGVQHTRLLRTCQHSDSDNLFRSWVRHPQLARIESLIAQIQGNPEDRVRRAALEQVLDAGIPDFLRREQQQQRRRPRLLFEDEEASVVQARGSMLMNLLGLADFGQRRGNYGLRILTIDGGGTKAVATIQILKRVEALTGQRTHQLFDLIAGTSTGAILAVSLGAKHSTLDEVEQLYMELSQQVFGTHTLKGSSRLVRGGSYYDTSVLERVLKENFPGNFIDSAADPDSPKIFCYSAVNEEPYVFRNYNPPLHSRSTYPGDAETPLWEALRATCAAPGYFVGLQRELRGKTQYHIDGGVLINNPSAVAIHEAKRLWGRNAPIECLLSLGTGTDSRPRAPQAKAASWLNVLETMINSATDSQRVHQICEDLLPTNVYFRINPAITEPYLNEHRSERLQQYKQETEVFLDTIPDLLANLAMVLNTRRQWKYRLKDWVAEHPAVKYLWLKLRPPPRNLYP